MRAFFRTLKVAKPWLFMCALASIYWLRKHTHLRTVDAYEALFAEILSYIKLGALLIVPVILLYFVIRLLAAGLAAARDRIALRSLGRGETTSYLPTATAASLGDLGVLAEPVSPLKPANFRDDPARFDRQIIRIEGRVEKVSRLRKRDALRRLLRRWIAKLFGRRPAHDSATHQRFFISSPQLKKGEWLLVLHNAIGKQIPLKRGMWIQVQGEYLHVTLQKGGLLRPRMNAYGRIHFTHAPKGSIAPIKADPKGIAQRKVELVTLHESPPRPANTERIERGLRGLPPLGSFEA